VCGDYTHITLFVCCSVLQCVAACCRARECVVSHPIHLRADSVRFTLYKHMYILTPYTPAHRCCIFSHPTNTFGYPTHMCSFAPYTPTCRCCLCSQSQNTCIFSHPTHQCADAVYFHALPTLHICVVSHPTNLRADYVYVHTL